MKRELLLGCGVSRKKKMGWGDSREWSSLTTLDHYPECQPDILWDLEKLPLPLETGSFDEIHAYEVLEHTGTQGDWRFFFDQFTEFWRILKPEGLFFATVPAGPWVWADPGHRRVITKDTLLFLSQAEYAKQVGVTPMSDYRFCYKADFEPVWDEMRDDNFLFALKAVK